MRVSVTLLDSYRYWQHGDFFTEDAEAKAYDELVRRIQGERLPRTEDMERGIAWHAIAEQPAKYYEGNVYRCDGFDFDVDAANAVLIDLPPDRVCEVKMVEDICGVTLVGVADYMHGLTAGDLKLTRKVTPDKYADSLQWRAYLMMMRGASFRYHVAQPRVNREGVITLADYKTFPFYRTAETDDDVRRAVLEFAEFAAAVPGCAL